MQYFSGKEILAGMGYHGWASYFWPPLYPILIGLASLVVPGFFGGMLISIVASAVLLYVAYRFAITLTNRKLIGYCTQLFLALCPLYVYESLQAHNHMLDSFFFVSGLWLFIRSLKHPTRRQLLAAGFVCGLAGLSRYTSYVLLALPFAVPMIVGLKRSLAFAIAFWFGFAFVSLPWWIYNALQNGSPLYTREYLNVCTAVPGNAYGTLQALWWCSGQSQFKNVWDIISAYPTQYLLNFLRNIRSGLQQLSQAGGVMAVFLLPGVFDSLFRIKLSQAVVLYGSLGLFVATISLAGVNGYYLLSWTVLIIIVSVTFLITFLDRCEQTWPILTRFGVRNTCIAVLSIAGLFMTANKLTSYVTDPNLEAGLAEVNQVSDALKSHDPDIATKVVMAVDPARAYYAGSKYLATPPEYNGSVEEMVQYQGLSDQVKGYAPKYPSTMEALRADYLVYTRTPEGLAAWHSQDLSQFSFLLDPESDKIPSNFTAIYRSAKVVVYEINWR